MKTCFHDGLVVLYDGDCLDALRALPAECVDSCVTDPPYGLSREPDVLEVVRHWAAGDDYAHKGGGFMGKTWDSFVPGPAVWREVMRVLKPGGHLAAFFGTRTYDLGTLAVRMAGFQVRDQLAWVYGSGFPKSLDVSKAIDKAARVTREVIGERARPDGSFRRRDIGGAEGIALQGSADGNLNTNGSMSLVTAPATDAARQWEGWGTALKPAWEPIVLARKPLAEGTVAANVLAHDTGAINVDGCRVAAPDAPEEARRSENAQSRYVGTFNGGVTSDIEARTTSASQIGRFPANLIHDGSPEVLAGFPQARSGHSSGRSGVDGTCFGHYGAVEQATTYKDTGSAARFFYCAKASKADRAGSKHPTVKPVALMRWLVRLITPPGGTVLDPFAGTGTTGQAAIEERCFALLCEREADYREDIAERMRRTRPWEEAPI